MAIPANTVTRVDYLGNDTASSFSFPFRALNTGEVSAAVLNTLDPEAQPIPLVLNTDFSASALPFPLLGGNIILLDIGQSWISMAGNLATGWKLTVAYAIAPRQLTSYRNLGPYSPIELEKSFDKITMDLLGVRERLNRAIRLNDLDDASGFNPQMPANAAGAQKRVLALNETGDGFIYGPTTDEIDTAQASALAAQESAQNALESEANALLSEEAAALSAEDALESEQNAEFFSNLLLFDESQRVDDEDSPITTDLTTDGTLFLTNATSDDVIINLPELATVGAAWKIGVIKTSNSVNFITVVPNGLETINGQPSFTYDNQDVGAIFYKNSDTDWNVKIFTFGEAQSGGSLIPPGGDTGAAFVKNSSVDGDVVWDDFVIEGFSARFNAAWSSAGLRDTILKILNISYLPPLVTLSGSSQTLREKGNVVSSITLSANVTKRSDNIARIRFLQGATEIADNNPPSNVGSGITTAPYNTPFSDNITFTVQVTDDGTQGGPTQVNANTTYSFVYPYYFGAGVPGLTSAQVAGLTKSIINSNANLNRTFTAAGGDVYYFAYPTSYGALSSILDENGFETFGAWTLRTESITGLDGNPVSYRIYEFNNPVSAGTTNFTFIR